MWLLIHYTKGKLQVLGDFLRIEICYEPRDNRQALLGDLFRVGIEKYFVVIVTQI